MAYKIISADTHLDLHWLPPDLFVSRAPEAQKLHMPNVQTLDRGDYWFVQGREFCAVGFGSAGIQVGQAYVSGEDVRLDRMAEAGFFEGVSNGIYHPANPDLRVKDQDIDGIDAEVIYGILGIGGGVLGLGDGMVTTPGPEAETLTTIYDVYNEYVAELVTGYERRLAGLACITSHDPQVSARQLRRAAELGLKGAEINVSQMIEPIYHEDWDVLWDTAAECEMPISFHSIGLSYAKTNAAEQKKYEWVDTGLLYILFQLSGAEFLVSVLLSGACERYPGFNFVLGECGIGWLPYVLERTDNEYRDHLFHLELPHAPTDYWRRQGYSTFQEELVSLDQVERIGVNNIMWGSDYPHQDGVFPDSRKTIQEGLGHLPEEVVRKIVCENAARVYKFN